MSHKTLINGTAYNVIGGTTLVNGTSYSISKGNTLVGGTAYSINFGSPVAYTDYTGVSNSGYTYGSRTSHSVAKYDENTLITYAQLTTSEVETQGYYLSVYTMNDGVASLASRIQSSIIYPNSPIVCKNGYIWLKAKEYNKCEVYTLSNNTLTLVASARLPYSQANTLYNFYSGYSLGISDDGLTIATITTCRDSATRQYIYLQTATLSGNTITTSTVDIGGYLTDLANLRAANPIYVSGNTWICAYNYRTGSGSYLYHHNVVEKVDANSSTITNLYNDGSASTSGVPVYAFKSDKNILCLIPTSGILVNYNMQNDSATTDTSFLILNNAYFAYQLYDNIISIFSTSSEYKILCDDLSYTEKTTDKLLSVMTKSVSPSSWYYNNYPTYQLNTCVFDNQYLVTNTSQGFQITKFELT